MKRLIVLTAISTWLGCSSQSESKAPITSSTLEGLLAMDSFTSAPRSVDAVDEKNQHLSSPVASSGAFRLSLVKGHHYRLTVITANGSEPMVFPRAGKFETGFDVTGGAALVSLGTVRHFDRAPAGGFGSSSVTKSAESSEAPGKECEDGVLQGSGEACVDEDGQLSCEENHDAAGDGECQDGKDVTTGAACTDDDQVGETPDDQADGECENGKDVTTGATCVDDELADPNQPMAVPAHNVPLQVGGCSEEDHDGEEKD
ncbi:MAG: hypothetical protein QM778_30240 [Myxococcales bacterium]